MLKQNKTVVILDQASGYLQIDMLEAYAEKFDKCSIVAGSIVERSSLLPKSVKWHKTVKYNRKNLFTRLLTWFVASFQMLFIVLFNYRKAHIVAITNPPFSVFVPWALGCSYDVVIYDIYPDALKQYQYVKETSFIYRFWSRLNIKMFSSANKIFTLTSGMKDLVSQYVDDNAKIEIVPLWSDEKDFKEITKSENKILKKTSGLSKFNIVYSGNLGMTHPVEKIIELGHFLKGDLFNIIIIGEGAKKKQIDHLIEHYKFDHVHSLPWQPIEFLPHNLFAADLNVVTLDDAASNLSIPSKTFNILSVGNPILGICSSNSALAQLIMSNNCGLVSSGNDIKELSDQIIQLASDKQLLKSFRENSFNASKNFTKENAKAYVW
ncbi:glycosyltransferase family 4 protein [Psychroflexus sp. MES1-P1E]|uniref:glycosyltransferase family 4 protein n=1 Tax=Psychroflexus sp. MES1-P1E TaxID=2058320 RepID=UPI0015E1158F|nr:glycosyltransferase family 4 protein [Psychroflexus sp. MES1-P1E]